MTTLLWPGGPEYDGGDALGICTDSVMLAAFAGARGAKRCVDLGCGGGILTVLLALSRPGLRVEAMDILPQTARLCEENIRRAGVEGRCHVMDGDMRRVRELLPPGIYDIVVSNPPYFAEGSGAVSSDPARAAARSEGSCTLKELCAAAAYLCRTGGSFCLVHRPERLADVFAELRAAGFEPKRLRLVCHAPGSAPSLALVEGRRGGKPGLDIEASLVLHDAEGRDSEEARRIFHLEDN